MTTVHDVVVALVDRVASQSDHIISWVPHYRYDPGLTARISLYLLLSCPLPCEHKYSVWRNLFIVSAILNLCLLIAVLPFIRRMAKNDASEALISHR